MPTRSEKVKLLVLVVLLFVIGLFIWLVYGAGHLGDGLGV
jgi:hypothetical protein